MATCRVCDTPRTSERDLTNRDPEAAMRFHERLCARCYRLMVGNEPGFAVVHDDKAVEVVIPAFGETMLAQLDHEEVAA